MGFDGQPDPLRSQGSLVLVPAENGHEDVDEDHDEGHEGHALLFAVNAGSNDISVLAVKNKKLKLVSKTPSGGVRPTSVTVHNDLLYVLNAGSGTINGFRIDKHGALTPIPGSSRPTTGNAGGDPSEVSFSPDGKILVVTDKSPNIIDTYLVDKQGIATGPMLNLSNGATPFGFAFDHNHLVVAEADHSLPNLSSASSYNVSSTGTVTVISGSVHNGQTGSCWLVITENGHFVYISNAGSSDLSSYMLQGNGTLTLLNGVAATTDAGSAPVDLALTDGSHFLYVLNDVTGTIDGYRVAGNGSLTPVASAGGLPPDAQGLAAR
jgi:6-phosphogluconolactonase (cycloisomerase 2 family)